jgi:hypothetical protein
VIHWLRLPVSISALHTTCPDEVGVAIGVDVAAAVRVNVAVLVMVRVGVEVAAGGCGV